MAFSNYLLLPINVGPEVTPVQQHTSIANETDLNPNPEQPEYFKTLIDNFNAVLLQKLSDTISGESYLLAFVRGSVVKSRLELAHTFWARLDELFQFDEIIAALAREHSQTEAENLLARIRRDIIATLLHDRRKLGAAKLIFRLDDPCQDYCSPETYSECAAFITNLAQLGSECDASVLEVLRATDLGDAQPFVRRQFQRLLQKFALHSISEQVENRLKQFVEIQREAQCLHPALPITEPALERLQSEFAVDAETAHKLVVLFRLAWLCCCSNKPKYHSDLAFKSVVVLPQPVAALSETQSYGETVLMKISEVLAHTCREREDLHFFCKRFPHVGITNMAFVLLLPRPLYDLFIALEHEDERFTFITAYRMGGAYFKNFLERASANLAERSRNDSSETIDFESLVEQIVYLRIGANAEGFHKHETLEPFTVSRDQLLQWLAAALREPQGEHMHMCSTYFDELTKYDLPGNIRGLAMIKPVKEPISE